MKTQRQRTSFSLCCGLLLCASAAFAQPPEATPVQRLAPIKAGKVPVEQAWQKGELLLDEAVSLLLEPDISDKARRELLELLAREDWERLLPPEGRPSPIPIEVRRAVGQFLRSRHDERALDLFSRLVEEAQPGTDKGIMLYELYGTYSLWGRQREAADALVLAAPQIGEKHLSWMASTLLTAARIYHGISDEAQSRALYDQVYASGSGWEIAHAMRDRASQLMQEGRDEEARAVLLQPVTGVDAAHGQAHNDMMLAWLFERAEDPANAEKWARHALEVQAGIKGAVDPGRGLDSVPGEARRHIERAAQLDRALATGLSLDPKRGLWLQEYWRNGRASFIVFNARREPVTLWPRPWEQAARDEEPAWELEARSIRSDLQLPQNAAGVGDFFALADEKTRDEAEAEPAAPLAVLRVPQQISAVLRSPVVAENAVAENGGDENAVAENDAKVIVTNHGLNGRGGQSGDGWMEQDELIFAAGKAAEVRLYLPAGSGVIRFNKVVEREDAGGDLRQVEPELVSSESLPVKQTPLGFEVDTDHPSRGEAGDKFLDGKPHLVTVRFFAPAVEQLTLCEIGGQFVTPDGRKRQWARGVLVAPPTLAPAP